MIFNQTPYRIAICLLSPILLITVLLAYSKHISFAKSSFIRFFPPHMTNNFKYIDLGFNSYYFAGTDGNAIYLGNYTAPLIALKVDNTLGKKDVIRLNVAENIDMDWERARLFIDSNNIFLGEGSSPKLLFGKLANQTMEVNKCIGNGYFDQSWLPISQGSFITRKYDITRKQNDLTKEVGQSSQNYKRILEKQIDGKFCTDGSLVYNRSRSLIIYTYNYRNQFIVMDTNLNIISRYKTIDTTSRAKIKIDTIYSESRVSFSAPPLIVNKRSCTDSIYLFIHSGLFADNERSDSELSDIDIYDLRNGRYLYSFELAMFMHKKLSSMIVLKGKLYLIYGNYLVCHDLNFYAH